MKTTRRQLNAECLRLKEQLAATGHQSRKNRAAVTAKLREENDALNKRIAALSTENASLRDKLATPPA